MDKGNEIKQTIAKSIFKKLVVKWINETKYFVPSYMVADSFVLHNRYLLAIGKDKIGI
jgi:hypothetical protein